jgi:tRNA modification GTPase
MRGPEVSATIYALASGSGKAAVAVIRISGPNVAPLLRALIKSVPAARVATLRPIVEPTSGEIIDHGLVLWFPAPHSFTGEDCAELQIHGSRAVVQAVLRLLGQFPDARLALPGEFARRALANGKMDLIGIEALGDLIAAETEQQRRLATIGASGSLQQLIGGLRHRIVDLMAIVETDLDFSDEEDRPNDPISQVQNSLAAIQSELEVLRSSHDRAELIRDGLTVLIAGPPNAGKSSLLNSLARREAAIVSEYAGTTRDIIEVRMDLGGFPVNLIDTAGIRESHDPVEWEGIKRALAKSQSADLVLWLGPLDFAAVEPPEELLRRPLWRVASKSDLCKEDVAIELAARSEEGVFPLSVKSGLNIELLIERLHAFANENMTISGSLVLANERQRHAVELALDALADARRVNVPLEILAEDLRRVCFALESLIGRVGVEDVLDSLFSRFCIGK